MPKNSVKIILILILVIASFFRLWQLNSMPPGLYPDVAMNGNNVLDSLKTGDFKVFYTDNNGREGLFMWLMAASFLIFGVSVWSLKFTGAIIGILTVLGLYLLIKELFKTIKSGNNGLKTEAIALLSSFFLAVSFWHTNFSRIGFRAVLLPFVLVFSFYFLFKGFRTKKFLHFALAGLFFGLGFYTYTTYRLIVLLIPIVLIIWWLIQRDKKIIPLIASGVLITFIIALPLGVYFLQNPNDLVSRATGVSVFAQESPIKAFSVSLLAHLAMFNFYGDGNWRHNYPGSPMLPLLLGILFLIGIIYSIKKIFSAIKNKDLPQFSVYLFLISFFLVMLLPSALTYEGIPHSLRSIGAIPAVYIFSGLGGWWIYEKLSQRIKFKKLLIVFCVIVIAFIGYSEFNKYFVKWAKNPIIKEAFTQHYVDIGNYLNSLPGDLPKYVIVNEPGVLVPLEGGLPVSAQTIMFIERTKYQEIQSVYLLPENLNKITIEKNAVIVPMKYEGNLENQLRQKFPNGKIIEENGVWIFKI